MAGEKNYKRIWLPEGVERAEIVPKSKAHPIREEQYDKALEQDFDAHRAEYREVLMYGVAVKVKVQKQNKIMQNNAIIHINKYKGRNICQD